jgi:hypothetical protein
MGISLEEFETPTEERLGALGMCLYETKLGSPAEEKALLTSLYTEGQTIWLAAPAQEREKVRRDLARLVCSFYKTCGDRCFTRVDKYVIVPAKRLENQRMLGQLAAYEGNPMSEMAAFARSEIGQEEPIRTSQTGSAKLERR